MPACVVLLGTVGLAGCGSKDFANEPRAAIPYETTASIGAKAVNISPDHFGAGITVITVANLTNDPASFEIKGPTQAQSGTIQPRAVTTIKTTLVKGSYQAIAKGVTGVKPATLSIGPDRPTSQNQLLQP
jgi:hypothetical protein